MEEKLRKYIEICHFDKNQLMQIKLGLCAGHNVDIYAKPEFTGWQMEQIRIGMDGGLDVTKYAKLEYTEFQMHVVRVCLEKGISLDKTFTIADIFEISELMYDIGFDTDNYSLL